MHYSSAEKRLIATRLVYDNACVTIVNWNSQSLDLHRIGATNSYIHCTFSSILLNKIIGSRILHWRMRPGISQGMLRALVPRDVELIRVVLWSSDVGGEGSQPGPVSSCSILERGADGQQLHKTTCQQDRCGIFGSLWRHPTSPVQSLRTGIRLSLLENVFPIVHVL